MVFVAVYGIGLVVILIFMLLLWLVSLPLKNASIVDMFWGAGFALLSLVYFGLTPEGFMTRKVLITALVMIWGLRLSAHIMARNWKHDEDFRYQQWRKGWGRRYWWVSLFQVFGLQGMMMWLVSVPILAAQFGAEPQVVTVFDGLGLALWCIGFLFEAVGDWQLRRFKADSANQGKLLTNGLWAYTRHPNYFGDAAVWWGYFMIALATVGGWLTVFSPIVMTYLLMKVSGAALLEHSLKKSKPDYEEYMKSTPTFFPRFPRK